MLATVRCMIGLDGTMGNLQSVRTKNVHKKAPHINGQMYLVNTKEKGKIGNNFVRLATKYMTTNPILFVEMDMN